MKFLDRYTGEDVDELIGLAGEYRVDSIVLAFEEALLRRTGGAGLGGLNEAELTIVAVEALEREVNNGGYHQFFLNRPECGPLIVAALRRIGCLKAAEISALALSLLGLCEPFTTDDVCAAVEADPGGNLIGILSDRCDAPFFDAPEPIDERLFAYIAANRGAIRLRG